MARRGSVTLTVIPLTGLALAACSGSGTTGDDGLPWWGWLLIILATVLVVLLIWSGLVRGRRRRTERARPTDMAVRVRAEQPAVPATPAEPEPIEGEEGPSEDVAAAEAIEVPSEPPAEPEAAGLQESTRKSDAPVGPEDSAVETDPPVALEDSAVEAGAPAETEDSAVEAGAPVETEDSAVESDAAVEPEVSRDGLAAPVALEDSRVEADEPAEALEAAPSEAHDAPRLIQADMFAPDDLTVLEGIGPKVSSLLNANGITTYTGLAIADVERLRGILVRANLPMIDPISWSEQAVLATAGKWDELAALQGQLKGGRRE